MNQHETQTSTLFWPCHLLSDTLPFVHQVLIVKHSHRSRRSIIHDANEVIPRSSCSKGLMPWWNKIMMTLDKTHKCGLIRAESHEPGDLIVLWHEPVNQREQSRWSNLHALNVHRVQYQKVPRKSGGIIEKRRMRSSVRCDFTVRLSRCEMKI